MNEEQQRLWTSTSSEIFGLIAEPFNDAGVFAEVNPTFTVEGVRRSVRSNIWAESGKGIRYYITAALMHDEVSGFPPSIKQDEVFARITWSAINPI